MQLTSSALSGRSAQAHQTSQLLQRSLQIAEKSHLSERGEAKQKVPTHLSRGIGSPEPSDFARATLLLGAVTALRSAPAAALVGSARRNRCSDRSRASETEDALHCLQVETDTHTTCEELGAFLPCLHLQDSTLPPEKASLRLFTPLPASAVYKRMP